ncbi:peptidase S8/S53 domain-containing protein [Tanacetum coccineum]
MPSPSWHLHSPWLGSYKAGDMVVRCCGAIVYLLGHLGLLLFELVSFEEKYAERDKHLYKEQGQPPRIAAQMGTIIGVLDTGITPGHLSFHNKGMPPPPSRWKGKCEVAACNNKLIGMRNFVRGSSAVDQQGHGTHTSSTAAAGNFVGTCAAIQKGILVTCSAGDLGPSIVHAIEGRYDNINVKGKVVLCDMGGVTDGIEKGMVVKEARGAAMILANTKTVCPESTVPDPHASFPASNIASRESGLFLYSRGPNLASPGILKPRHNFGLQVLTSLQLGLRSVYKNGKPIVDERELPADIFAIGASHVNPSKANDPGLIFDIKPDDYILYLCGLGYTTKQIRMIAKKTVTGIKSIPEAELNYPSFSVMLKRGDNKTYSRTVTNVGIPRSRYTIGNVSLPRGVRVKGIGRVSLMKSKVTGKSDSLKRRWIPISERVSNKPGDIVINAQPVSQYNLVTGQVIKESNKAQQPKVKPAVDEKDNPKVKPAVVKEKPDVVKEKPVGVTNEVPVVVDKAPVVKVLVADKASVVQVTVADNVVADKEPVKEKSAGNVGKAPVKDKVKVSVLKDDMVLNKAMGKDKIEDNVKAPVKDNVKAPVKDKPKQKDNVKAPVKDKPKQKVIPTVQELSEVPVLRSSNQKVKPEVKSKVVVRVSRSKETPVKRKRILSKEDDIKKKLKGKSKKEEFDFELKTDIDSSSDEVDRKRKKLKIKVGLKRKRSGSDCSDFSDCSDSSSIDTENIKRLISKLEKKVKKQESDEESVPKKGKKKLTKKVKKEESDEESVPKKGKKTKTTAMTILDNSPASYDSKYKQVCDLLDCGLPVESQLQRDMLRRLRFKFAMKILLHEINVHAEKMLELAKEFDKKDPVEKMAMIVDALKNREQRDRI